MVEVKLAPTTYAQTNDEWREEKNLLTGQWDYPTRGQMIVITIHRPLRFSGSGLATILHGICYGFAIIFCSKFWNFKTYKISHINKNERPYHPNLNLSISMVVTVWTAKACIYETETNKACALTMVIRVQGFKAPYKWFHPDLNVTRNSTIPLAHIKTWYQASYKNWKICMKLWMMICEFHKWLKFANYLDLPCDILEVEWNENLVCRVVV